MKKDNILTALFFLIAAAIVYLFYRLIVPFFLPICWAGVFVIVFFPFYKRLLRAIKLRGLATLLMCLLIIIVIIGPLTYLLVLLVKEAADAVAVVNEWYLSGKLKELLTVDIPILQTLRDTLGKYYDISNLNLDEIIRDAIQKVGGFVVERTGWLVSHGTRAVFDFLLMVVAMYYFFRDGQSIVSRLRRFTPLSEGQTGIAVEQLNEVIQATVNGVVVIALLQGLLGGLLFFVTGLPSPVFWGAVMAFMSFIPLAGPTAIYLPAGVLLILTGSVVKGLVVIAFGAIVISQVDNLLRPLLISGRTSLHPLLLFFMILGGVAVFGLLGVVLGPIIAAAFTILLKVIEMRLHPDDTPPVEKATGP